MSNVIKAYTVRYGEEGRKTIDTHLRIDFFQSALSQQTAVRARGTAASSGAASNGTVASSGAGCSGEFVEGLRAVAVDGVFDEEEQEGRASTVLENARKEAGAILEAAKKEAEQLKKEAYAKAQKQGYDDGMLAAGKEQARLRSEYEEKASSLAQEYDRMWKELEPKMAGLIASLVEKLTGIMISDREDVILTLIEKALKSPEILDEVTVRVSKEDYGQVSSHREMLTRAMARELPIYIVEDAALIKNQCLLETGQKVINCSLDAQLRNLVTDIRMISSI